MVLRAVPVRGVLIQLTVVRFLTVGNRITYQIAISIQLKEKAAKLYTENSLALLLHVSPDKQKLNLPHKTTFQHPIHLVLSRERRHGLALCLVESSANNSTVAELGLAVRLLLP
jgi:hypothetical protein